MACDIIYVSGEHNKLIYIHSAVNRLSWLGSYSKIKLRKQIRKCISLFYININFAVKVPTTETEQRFFFLQKSTTEN